MIFRTTSFALIFTLAFSVAAQSAAQDIPAAVGNATEESSAEDAKPAGPKLAPNGEPMPAAKAAPGNAASTKPAPVKGIVLSPNTPIAPSANAPEKVVAECGLQTILAQAIAERSANVVLSDGIGASKLELKIVDVHAPKGGFFSGPKWITVEGRLLEGKKVKGSFTAKETSMGSVTACAMLTKVMRVLADDVVIWLANPTLNAKLGRAK